ncbi:YlxR family protein [Euhalothece natronophila Z-M001]|uniref:YlxR family protein n=1 Tax=Euhalothece natronophila Z-M001 TaxID=522448 RepID=A0A5B8NPM4_9CHRO|nr:YlxR family protein [Euhalothece natronophila]QDZ40974.1 YlxR family protein [Euhalothece natronophila Z-M001]
MKKNYRRCISCRRVAPKEEFLRVVRTHPSRTVKLNQGMGRSAYICPCENCLKTAQHKNRLGRALKAQIPEEIYEQLWEKVAQVSTPQPSTSAR